MQSNYYDQNSQQQMLPTSGKAGEKFISEKLIINYASLLADELTACDQCQIVATNDQCPM